MATNQFLVRNRHCNIWYGRIVIPLKLREHFNGKRELRKSLGTPERKAAKRLALEFWIECQNGFDQLDDTLETSFTNTAQFLTWMAEDIARQETLLRMPANKKIRDFLEGRHEKRYLDLHDPFGNKTRIDLGDPEKEAALALKLQEKAAELLERYKDNPAMLDRLFKTQNAQPLSASPDQPESPTPLSEAIDLYITKLNSQGRKGKKLAQRTLLNYQGRLEFWKEYFGDRFVHDITLKELSTIQDWLTRLPPNYGNKGLTTLAAIEQAKSTDGKHPAISDKTRAEYLGQLKGILEYVHSCGFIASDLSSHIEIPNTKQSKTVERLPFSNDDLAKMFPGEDYGADFGRKATGFDEDAKFWIPLMAAFSGARLEEICQLKTSDIKTDKETGIVYADITEGGTAADGEKKKAKSKSSVRPIPIHSTLIETGLMDYVKARKKDRSDKALFKLKRDKQGRLGKGFSNWFSRFEPRKGGKTALGYIERRGVESKGMSDGQKWTKTFHSFRHAAIDNLRNNKKLPNGEYILETHIGIVMGHTKERLETAQYGQNRSQLELRKDVIEAIEFPSVDFKAVNWKPI